MTSLATHVVPRALDHRAPRYRLRTLPDPRDPNWVMYFAGHTRITQTIIVSVQGHCAVTYPTYDEAMAARDDLAAVEWFEIEPIEQGAPS